MIKMVILILPETSKVHGHNTGITITSTSLYPFPILVFPENTISMNWNFRGDVISADFSNTHCIVTCDNKGNPFIGFPEKPAVLTGIINLGAYFMSLPTKNNVTEVIAVSGQNTSRMSLKYEYNSNSLPTRMYEGTHDESGLDSVICEFTY